MADNDLAMLEEQLILEEVRELRKENRYGKVEIVVQSGKVDTISSTRVRKSHDWVEDGLTKNKK